MTRPPFVQVRALQLVACWITLALTSFAQQAQVRVTGRSPVFMQPGGAVLTAINPSAESNQRGTLYPHRQTTAPKVNLPASPSFLPAAIFDSGGTYSYLVAVADLNSDGKLDVIVVNGNGGAVGLGVLLGNGDGTFQAAVKYSSGGNQPASVAIADVNGDHKLDLVVTNTISNSVGVLLGNGDGTFQPVVNYIAGGSPWTEAVADLNGDGKPDIIVGNQSECYACGQQGSVGVLLGNGDGTFQQVTTFSSGGYSPGTNPTTVVVSDFNRDGKLDVAITNGCGQNGDCSEGGSVAVLLGDGTGKLGSPTNYGSGGQGISIGGLAAGDVNGDGKSDLLVVNGNCLYGSTCSVGTVGVLLGNGDGSFQPVVLYDSGAVNSTSVAVADVNNDSIPDLVVTNFCATTGCSIPGEGSVSILVGSGSGSFTLATTYPSGGYWGAFSIAVADVNGDGRPDLLLADLEGLATGDGTVSVLLNNTSSCTTPPQVIVSVTPTFLWPPSRNMVPVTVSGTITDSMDCTVTAAAYAVTDEYGEVQPSGPVTLGPGGTYHVTVLLQSSRLGTDIDGRLYTIAVSASNNAGKTGAQAAAVIVPHDQGH